MTALHHAVRQGYVETARGARSRVVPTSTSRWPATAAAPLVVATINGQFDVAMLLIEKGADPNIAMKGTGVTPLWAAINTQWQPRTRFPQPQNTEQQKHTYLEVMEALLKTGADVNARITSHPWIMVYTGCGNSQLRAGRHVRLDGVLARGVFGRCRCDEAARQVRR